MKRMLACAFAACVLAISCMAASSHETIKVICGEALDLTSESAMRKDWGGTSVWEAAAHEDTLVLSRKGQCGDECSYEERIVFTSLDAKCPELISATVTKHDRGSPVPKPRVQTAAHGILHIQDWNPAGSSIDRTPTGGIVSGKLDAEIKLTFYAQIPAWSDTTKPK